MATTVVWRGDREVRANMGLYGAKVMELARQVAAYFAPIVESYAKSEARWEDRTGAARSGLTTVVADLSETVVVLYLYHKMSYGVYLETLHSGKFAIVLEALEAHYEPVMKMLREALK